MMQMEILSQPVQDYLGWLADIRDISPKEREKKRIEEKMRKLKSESGTAVRRCVGRAEAGA